LECIVGLTILASGGLDFGVRRQKRASVAITCVPGASIPAKACSALSN
jgi:hypothetical protein